MISDKARNSHSTPDVSELLRSRRGELDSLGYHLLRHGQKFFSGRLDVHSSLQDCKWSIFFAKGRIVWATGGKDVYRRSRRNLVRFVPQLNLADRRSLDTAGHETYWDYYLLQLLLQKKLVALKPIQQIIEASIAEVCFDILQQETQETTLYQTVYAGANFLWPIENTPLTGLVWQPSPIFAAADQKWQEWQAAKLGLCNPNHAPLLRAQDKVKQHTSEQVYRSFCKGFNGDRSLRDLACLMKKDLLRISKSLLPYIRRGWIELVEVEDDPSQVSRSPQAKTKPAPEPQESMPTKQLEQPQKSEPVAVASPPVVAQQPEPAKPKAIELEIKAAPEIVATPEPKREAIPKHPTAKFSAKRKLSIHQREKMNDQQNRWHQRRKAANASKFQELKIAFLDPDEVELDSSSQEIQPGQQQPPLIACIDDSRAIGLLMRDIITKAGYRFVYIEDPLKAIATLRAEPPSLIFLDLIMPGATGFQVCSQLRKLPGFKNLPVVMLTSNRGIIDRIHARCVRTSEYINKPIKADQILSTIDRYLPDQLPLVDHEQEQPEQLNGDLSADQSEHDDDRSAVANNPDKPAADVIPLVDRVAKSEANGNGRYLPAQKAAEP
ncbi:response regulator receiver protein [Thalassoporum mexicanum PCC 7367]|uniref:response regulator n=1 Tax=Thalassoporum mexicanum TaxID=3457544 RepID=UPI00029F9A5C|nr:response regulator [Pseudanabaena sp. PCC 7367]AFY69158.1 response regulator receiver protein [Pseudanabaena sp. PCC 7367]